MTSKQLERKINQLHYRKRLIETVESLEEAVKAFMITEGKEEIRTEKFVIRLAGETLNISLRPSIHLNQLTFKFLEKEEFNYETNRSKETVT